MVSTSPRPLRIGLTGGIASGKSAVTDLFAACGAPIIDTDLIARQVVEPGRPALGELVEAFGTDILQPDGRLDRAALRARVFADAPARKRLEALLHPRIRAATVQAAEDTAAASPAPYLIIAVPLLIETDFTELMDRILVVDCPTDLQRRRLMERDGIDGDTADAMIRSQASREARLAAADDVIRNDGPLSALKPQVDALDRRYRTLGGA